MRLTVCLEGNAEGRVLASVDMEEIVKMTITDDIEKSNFNPQMLKGCTDTSYQCGYEQGKTEGRKEAILYVRKLIKIFWKDWNNTSHKKLPYLAFEELDEHILEQADESNGREFMQWYKEQNK